LETARVILIIAPEHCCLLLLIEDNMYICRQETKNTYCRQVVLQGTSLFSTVISRIRSAGAILNRMAFRFYNPMYNR